MGNGYEENACSHEEETEKEMTRKDLIGAIVEVSSERVRKLGGRKLQNYASAKLTRTPTHPKGLSVKLSRRRQRNKARGYYRETTGQRAAEIAATAKSR